MQAYAILDGGGVKGAALAGCLKAAQEIGIEFIAYGGTSAGSIIATLAAVGYTGQELEQICTEEIEFYKFLDDDGVRLRAVQEYLATNARLDLSGGVRSILDIVRALRGARPVLGPLLRDLGLYEGHRLKEYVLRKIRLRVPALRHVDPIRFGDLVDAGCAPLKVVASDLRSHAPEVFDVVHSPSMPVVDAVRASISYPFVFKPVPMGGRYLVDGGLASNLPVFLFEHERRQRYAPVVAFDLVTPPKDKDQTNYSFKQMCADLLDTSIDASDRLLGSLLEGLLHVRVDVDPAIHATDFWITLDQRRDLFRRGELAVHRFFRAQAPQFLSATDEVERLQASYAEPALMREVLRAVARDFEEFTGATNVRCHVMLPTARATRIVVYQYGMDEDADRFLELPDEVGCSGEAWETRAVAVADLVQARQDPAMWGMTPDQQARIPERLRSMLSVPIFELGRSVHAGEVRVEELPLIGTLSIDSDRALDRTGWVRVDAAGEATLAEDVLQRLLLWSDVVGKVLT